MVVTLFEKKQDCCGCGACKNICPQDAISLVPDEDGYTYPRIDMQRCVECGACKKVCGYQRLPQRFLPKMCYAVAAKDTQLLGQAASGGVFAAMATEVLRKGGVVYGVALRTEEQGLTARHIRIDKVEELPTLQGSKYVQSDTGTVYRQAKQDLQEDKQVLFSGTPCQIAGLVAYLGKKYPNLLTIEVICHGVPSGNMFRDFLKILGEKKNSAVTEFAFRTKDKGQGENTRVVSLTAEGKRLITNRNGNLYSYIYYFLKSYICRSGCYSCPFATAERVADITIGDYWGFHQEHPMLPSSVKLSNAAGVSCVLINTECGIRSFEACRSALSVLETDFKKIAKHNAQLRAPCSYHQERDVILRLYREAGYGAVEQHYRKTCRKDRAVSMVQDWVPKGLKRTMKRIIGLLR